MKTRQKTMYLMLVVISLLFTVLAGLQVYLYNHTKELERHSFDNVVESALSSIVQKAETVDIAKKIITMNFSDTLHHHIVAIDSCDTTIIRAIPLTFLAPGKDPKDSISMQIVKGLDTIDTRDLGNTSSVGNRLVYTYNKTVSDSVNIKKAEALNVMIKVATLPDDSPKTFHERLNERRLLIEKIVNDLTVMNPLPVMKRIRPAVLDSIIAYTLDENGIDLEYGFAIMDTDSDSLLYKSDDFKDRYVFSSFTKQLFPNDLMLAPAQLYLYFPGQSMFLLKRSGVWIATTLFFILVLVFCFIYIVRLLFKQKRFYKQIVGFINNMTHEFKTPISTLSLVGESLQMRGTSNGPEKLERYSRVIQDESTRMRNQVEKILQMAAIESGEIDLENKRIDVHDLLTLIIEKYRLWQNRNHISMITDFRAQLAEVIADPLHLENVFNNLVDNAVKYNHNTPEIVISSENDKNRLRISFKDNGIGISAEDQKLIFNTYYRVPTGNLHDVKGFGLGLSYVQRIVTLFGGSVAVSSKPGNGSRFDIILPLAEQKHI